VGVTVGFSHAFVSHRVEVARNDGCAHPTRRFRMPDVDAVSLTPVPAHWSESPRIRSALVPALRRRLDVEMVRRGLAESRQVARRHIELGQVRVSGAVADKPGRLVAVGEPVAVAAPPPRYVSRGALKLEAALDAFALDPTGLSTIDVGASTGGFTDCLLQRGAAQVVALDVGHGQIHERLRADDRVRVVERCNVRDLAPERCSESDRRALVGEPAPLVVTDLSFISLRTAASGIVGLVQPDGHLVALVKPQFEAGRAVVSQGAGVVTSPEVWRSTLVEVVGHYASLGFGLRGVIPSPIQGAQGNVEFLAHLARGGSSGSGASEDVAVLIDGAMSSATQLVGGSCR